MGHDGYHTEVKARLVNMCTLKCELANQCLSDIRSALRKETSEYTLNSKVVGKTFVIDMLFIYIFIILVLFRV